MAFEVIGEQKIDITKLTIERQLALCQMLIEAGYVVERQYRVTLTYEQALAYRKLTGHTVRKSYWKDLTIQVYIDLDIECR